MMTLYSQFQEYGTLIAWALAVVALLLPNSGRAYSGGRHNLRSY